MPRRLSPGRIAATLCLPTMAGLGVVIPDKPAHALVVFDPSNFSQNILTAARTLQQINNQIRSLQNEAQGLINDARNLSTIGFPEVAAITDALHQVDDLMTQAQGLQFRIAGLDNQFDAMFPQGVGASSNLNAQVIAARGRLDTEMAAYRQTMRMQAKVVENVQADRPVLEAIVARSQGAEGALQVGQATNQLLALATKQQFQLQSLMAAQYRAEAVERARRVQGETDARQATTRFLGSGSAYSPLPPGQ